MGLGMSDTGRIKNNILLQAWAGLWYKYYFLKDRTFRREIVKHYNIQISNNSMLSQARKYAKEHMDVQFVLLIFLNPHKNVKYASEAIKIYNSVGFRYWNGYPR